MILGHLVLLIKKTHIHPCKKKKKKIVFFRWFMLCNEPVSYFMLMHYHHPAAAFLIVDEGQLGFLFYTGCTELLIKFLYYVD